MASTLILASGVLPEGSAFNLRTPEGNATSINTLRDAAPGSPKGDVWIGYPHQEGLLGIGGENSTVQADTPKDILQEQETRNKIDKAVQQIAAEGELCAFHKGRAGRILIELMQNATLYGAISADSNCAHFIRLAWEFANSEGAAQLTLAVSNPIPKLFNPAKYLNIPFSQFEEIALQGGSGHVAIPELVGYLADGQKLHYLWDLMDGSKIICRLGAAESVGTDDENVELENMLINCATVEVSKYDSNDREVEYSLREFKADVAKGLPTESVTVAGIFANPRPEAAHR